jgi:hypothetical protein
MRALGIVCLVALLPGGIAGVAESAEFGWGRSIEGRPIGPTILGPQEAPARALVVGSLHGAEPAGTSMAERHPARDVGVRR